MPLKKKLFIGLGAAVWLGFSGLKFLELWFDPAKRRTIPHWKRAMLYASGPLPWLADKGSALAEPTADFVQDLVERFQIWLKNLQERSPEQDDAPVRP